METLKLIVKKVLSSILTEKVLKSVILFGLEEAVKRSSNKIDDEIVKIVKEALLEK